MSSVAKPVDIAQNEIFNKLEKRIQKLKLSLENYRRRYLSLLDEVSDIRTKEIKKEKDVKELNEEINRIIDTVEELKREVKITKDHMNRIIDIMQEFREKIYNLEYRINKLERWLKKH